MPLKTLLWGGFFAVTCIGALAFPMFGIIGYVGHYSIGPERQWWSAALRPLGLRYSFMLATCTAVGMALHWRKLRFGKALLGYEKVMLLLLAVVWLGTLFGPETVGRYQLPGIDHPSVKLAKIMVFALMLTHVVTDLKKLDLLLWALVIGALVLGVKAYSIPYGEFVRGRLESVGGPDFHDANRFAGYMAGMLFLIGAQFLRSRWRGKLLCLVAGVFTTNAIILARSRGAVLGVAVGLTLAMLLAPKKHRLKLLGGLVVAGLGALYLSDPQFLNRSSTILAAREERDTAATMRLEIWQGGLAMLTANPLGVGPGNFYQRIGEYAPRHPGRDAHNTFVRCAGELGFAGLAVFSAIVAGALLTLRRIVKEARDLPSEQGMSLTWASYGMMAALTAVLTYGLTGTVLYTEYLWWLLAMPLCLARVAENVRADQSVLAVPVHRVSVRPMSPTPALVPR